MLKQSRSTLPGLAALLACLLVPGLARSAEGDSRTLELADGKIQLAAPADWKSKRPLVAMIEAEFEVPRAEGDPADGRVTIMAAGGSLQANIARWQGQFADTTRNEVKQMEVGGHAVHLVDLAGTFKDQRGPFAPATNREDYRMLGAVIPTEAYGQYFIKFYGPQKTVTAHQQAFQKMIRSLQIR